MLAPNDAVGQSVAGALAEDYRKQGFEVVLDLFERGIKEFTPLILRMMAQKVDAFEFDGNSPGDAGLMLKQIRQAGFKGRVMQVGGPGSDEIIEIAGPAAEGFLSYGIFDWDTPTGQKLRPIYEKKYGKGIINQFMPAFYHSVFLLVDAIKRADSTDTTKVRARARRHGRLRRRHLRPRQVDRQGELRRQPPADVPLLLRRGEGRQARHQGEVHAP